MCPIKPKQLGALIDKKRTYILRAENNDSNLTLKTLFDIVEKDLEERSTYLLQ